MTALSLLAGLVLLFAGGEALVRGSVAVARRLGISPLLGGLTLVGFGRSLPELATSVIAAARGHADVAKPIPVPPDLRGLDMWVMAAAAALLIAFGSTAGRLDRRAGALMVSCDAVYLVAVLAA